MKKIMFVLFLACLSVSVLQAQTVVNDALAEVRPTGSFHGINVGTGVTLVLTAGDTEQVVVSAATEEFRDKIITRVDNGVLKIYYENKLFAPNSRKVKKELKAYVSYKMLDRLEANTGAVVKIDGTLESSSLVLHANTGAEVSGKITAGTLDVNQNTGSVITLTGTATSLDVDGDTGSMFNGEGLSTSTCNARVSTGAGVTVTAEKELYVKANTGGYVKYKGAAAVREIIKNTGGSVSRI